MSPSTACRIRQPVAHHIRYLQTALSINKSELARILRVPGPTVYDWLDGDEPNPDERLRIWTLLRLLAESRVSANDPLFRRFVRSAHEPGDRAVLDLLGEETIDEIPVGDALRRARVLGDAIHALREERTARQREAGFEEPDAEQRKAILATNVALMEWPKE